MTRTQAMMGSPLYMSPEQLKSSRDVDERSDIWALGVILHQLVTGQPPFLAETITELTIKIVTEPAPALRSIRPDLPEALERVVSRCLEKDRDRRYRNVGELAVALAPMGPARAQVSVDRILGVLRAAGSRWRPLAGSRPCRVAQRPW